MTLASHFSSPYIAFPTVEKDQDEKPNTHKPFRNNI